MIRDLLEKATGGEWHEGAQNDALYITAGEPPSINNDYPRHDAKRTVVAKPYRDRDAALIVALHNCADELLKVADAAEALSTVLFADDKHAYFMARNTDKQAGSVIVKDSIVQLKAALRALREKEGKL